MKTIRLIIMTLTLFLWAVAGSAQLGNLKNLGKKVLDKAAPAMENAGSLAGQGKNAPLQGKTAETAVTGGTSSVANAGTLNANISMEPGQVIFSSSPIDPASPAGLKSTFSAGDHLYAVASLPQTLKEIYVNAGPDEKLLVEVFIYEIKPPLYVYQQPREEQLTFANVYVSGKLKNLTHLVLDLVPDPASTQVYNTPELTWNKFGKKYEGPVGFAETLAKLEPGEHTLKVVVQCSYSPAASGTIRIKGEDFSGYNRMAEQLNEAGSAAGMANTRFPASVVSDAPREALMADALKNSNDWKSGFIDGTEVLKTAITYDWEIRRHEISGAILHRYCIAAIAFKTKNGGCAYRKITFQEDYAGGKFQPLRYDGAGDKVMMDCGKLNN